MRRLSKYFSKSEDTILSGSVKKVETCDTIEEGTSSPKAQLPRTTRRDSDDDDGTNASEEELRKSFMFEGDVECDLEFFEEEDQDKKSVSGSTVLGSDDGQHHKKNINIRNVFMGSSKTPKYNKDMLIIDPSLVAIGKQLNLIEAENRRGIEQTHKDWKKLVKPNLAEQIKSLEKRVGVLEFRIEKEVTSGMQHINSLEEQMNVLKEAVETKKKQMYFPKSAITLGKDGVYFALDDFWLEYASGSFILDVAPDKRYPEVDLTLDGTSTDPSKGLVVLLKVEGFKLAGDKGKSIPKLKFENLKVSLGLSCRVTFVYDDIKAQWTCKTFNLKLLSFKGPYGITRGIVGAILSLVTPLIKSSILEQLPVELGQFIRKLPMPCHLDGEFDVAGTQLDLLSEILHHSPVVQELCGYSSTQIEMFFALQKAMERSHILKTMSDLLAYQKSFAHDPVGFSAVIHLWDQAATMYSAKVIDGIGKNTLSQLSRLYPNDLTILFEPFMDACDKLQRKRIVANFEMYQVDGQLSLNDAFKYTHQFIHRISTEALEKANALQKSQLLATIHRLGIVYAEMLGLLQLISQNLDFAQWKVQASLRTGPDGLLKMSVKEILAQLPILLNLSISKPKTMGSVPLIPFIISFKPQPNGDIYLEINSFAHKDVPSNKSSSGAIDYNKHLKSIIAQTEYERSSKPLSPIIDESTFSSSQCDAPANMNMILCVNATSPQISIVVDRNVRLKAGAELFTLAIGPRNKGWRPFGTDAIPEGIEEEAKKAEPPHDNDSNNNNDADESASDIESTGKAETDLSPEEAGCPISIQTGPGIRMLAQIPNAAVDLHLGGLTRFVLEHFEDLQLLKEYLEAVFGGEFHYEELNLTRLILQKLSKYVHMPDCSADINVNGKIVALEREILVRLETPIEVIDARDSMRNGFSIGRPQRGPEDTSAVKVMIDINIRDVFEDFCEILTYFRNMGAD